MDTEFDSHNHKWIPLYDPAMSFVEVKVSDEEFNHFHTTERKLFYTLVRKLCRNVDESMHVVAFLIWLERICYSHNPVYKVIAWPFYLVDELASEIAGFLRCLEREKIGSQYISLYSVRKLCSRHIKLFDFHRKRNKILESVAKIVSEVCVRAFKDILISDSEFVDVEGDKMWCDYINPGGFPQIRLGGNLGSANFMAPTNNVLSVLEDPNPDCSEMFGSMQLANGGEDEPDVAPDDRTIFLTFSKGSYVPESQIREFFTRIFGEFIEDIHMQNVSTNQQPLNARMVCRSSSIISQIAPSNRKIKYSINGKRIMATKYIKKVAREMHMQWQLLSAKSD